MAATMLPGQQNLDQKEGEGELTSEQLEFGQECIDAIEDYAPDVRVDEALLKADAERQRNAPLPPPDPRYIAREGNKTFRTGPKGVKADYNEARLKCVANRLKDQIAYRKKVKRGALGADAPLHTIDAKPGKPKPKPERKSQEDDSESDWDDDPEAERMVKERIKLHMHNAPTFGEVRELNAHNFDEEVDGEDPSVVIVIHIYQDYLARCALMNDTFRRMAASWPQIKFMTGRTDHVLPDYPDGACPSFIVFRGGQQTHNLVDFLKDVGTPFSDIDVVRYFRDKGVLPKAVGDEAEAGADRDGQLQEKKAQGGDGDESDGSLDM